MKRYIFYNASNASFSQKTHYLPPLSRNQVARLMTTSMLKLMLL